MGVALPLYPQQPAPAWVEPYIGFDHQARARGPDAFDCWGLLICVLARECGFELPAYERFHWERSDTQSRRECADAIATAQREMTWVAVEPGQERRFDAILLSIAGRPLHVGIVAEPGWVLHSSEGAGSAVERYDGAVWRHRVDGFWRFEP